MKANYEVVAIYGSEVVSFGKVGQWCEACDLKRSAYNWASNEDKIWLIQIINL